MAKWQVLLSIAVVVAIALHFILGDTYAHIPLLIVIVVGGVPLLLEMFGKVIKGDFGADLMAALALVTATWLEEKVRIGLSVL